jgi:hypothetical protein
MGARHKQPSSRSCPLARPPDRGSGSEAQGAAPKSKPGGVEWGQDKGRPDTSMAKDMDLFLVSLVATTRRPACTSVTQALALAIPLANAPPPSRGPPPRMHCTARRLAHRAPPPKTRKRKPWDWDFLPPGLYVSLGQNQFFSFRYNGLLTLEAM